MSYNILYCERVTFFESDCWIVLLLKLCEFLFSGSLLLESKIQPDTAYQKQQVSVSTS